MQNLFNSKVIKILFLLFAIFFFLGNNTTAISAACHKECTCNRWVTGGECGYSCRDICDCDTYPWPNCCRYLCAPNKCCVDETCEWVDCCTPVACYGCTPSCPAGQSTTVSGPLCKQNQSSCTGTTNCSTCTLKGDSCYLPETNVAPPQPTSISITIGENNYNLSLDPNNPTKIKLPMEDEQVTLTVPVLTTPLTSRGVGYYFRAFDDVPSQIFTSTTPTGDPLTDPNKSNTQIFLNGDDLIALTDTGKIAGMYYTIDKCDNTIKYSTPVEGFFVVDNVPPIPHTPNCDPNSQVCDSHDFLPELGTQTTARGCQSDTYAGLEINNPLAFNISLVDEDGNNEIQALTLWFHANDSTKALTPTMAFNDNNVGIDNDEFGVLIKKGSDWNNPNIYQSNSDNTWTLINDLKIKDSSGKTVISILDLNIDTITNPSIDFTFKLQFHSGNGFTETPITNDYNVFAKGIDSFQIYNNKVEMDRLHNIFNFGIDLTNPTVENIQFSVQNVRETILNWESQDNDSGIYKTMINGYVLGGGHDITLENIGTQITIPSSFTSEQIGYFNDTYSLVVDPPDSNINVNIGENEIGSIDMHVTSYDNACNYNGASDQIELEPWIATKGGNFYSNQGVKTAAKDISTLLLPTAFTNFTKENITQGSEIMSTRSNYIYSLIHPELGGVSASSIYDSNDRKAYWFSHLIEKFNLQKTDSSITLKVLDNPNDTCNNNQFCYYQSENDVVLNDSYTCSGNKLIISNQSITIQPIREAEITNEVETCTTQSVQTGTTETCEYVWKANTSVLCYQKPIYKRDERTGDWYISGYQYVCETPPKDDGYYEEVCTYTPIYTQQEVCTTQLVTVQNRSQGCIYLAKENINISQGEYVSNDNLQYDYMEGFFIAQSKINIEYVDQDKDIRDGLEIQGGLVALGNEVTDDAISINRNLRLYNLIYPTVLVNYDFKYGKIAETFFGKEADIYKQETGFKNI